MEAEEAPDLSQEGDSEPRARRRLPRVVLPQSRLPNLRALRLPRPSGVSRLAAMRPKLRFSIPRRQPKPASAAIPDTEPQPAPAAVSGALSGARLRLRLSGRSPLTIGLVAIGFAVLFMSVLTYFGAAEFSGRAADTRAANEAMSFAQHSSRLATGDAFDGYIQILRYADDPIVNAKSTSANDRTGAMQRLLYLNNNKFTSLTVADRAGLILATTDSTMTTIKTSTVFAETRSNLGPANSDIVLPEAGRHGYVEYSAPLRSPDGSVWGILIGRADPATLWKGTLAAAVDGSRNVIINSEGQFAAGVPDELLRQPWHGQLLGNGAVRADIAGVDSICGLAPIGKDTQIDRGLNTASCLPASLIQVERHHATGKQGLVTIAGAVLALVVAGTILKIGVAPQPEAPAQRAGTPEPAAKAEAAAVVMDASPVREEAAPEPTADGGADTETDQVAHDEPQAVAVVVAAPPPPPPPDVDALTLIDAYEQRNARLAERIRESLQAKLLVAATQADEAYKLATTDAELASVLHARAMEELEAIRERELRAIGQELYPGLVRLGLPGALKALRKELADVIEVRLDIDPRTDSVSGGAGRASLDPAVRLLTYRFVFDAARALALAGARECIVALQRDADLLVLSASAATSETADGHIDRSLLNASALAVEAHAGFLFVSRRDDRVVLSIELPAPPISEVQLPEGYDLELEDGETDDAAPEADDDTPAASQAPAEPEAEAATEADDAAEALPDDTPAASQAPAEPEVEAATEADDAAEALPDDEPAPDDGPAPVVILVAANAAPPSDLTLAIEAIQNEMFGSLVMALDVDPALESGDGGPLPNEVRAVIERLVRAGALALRASEARQCSVSVKRAGDMLMLSIMSETGELPFDGAPISACESTVDAIGGYVAVSRHDNNVSITAEVMLPASTADATDAA